MLYNVVLESAVQQSESVKLYIYPLPSGPPPTMSRPSGSSQSCLPVLHCGFPLAICFTCGSVYMSISHFVPLSQSSSRSTGPLSMLVSTAALEKVHLHHFSRFRIYALTYDICFYLSDLLHSVWSSFLVFYISMGLTMYNIMYSQLYYHKK